MSGLGHGSMGWKYETSSRKSTSEDQPINDYIGRRVVKESGKPFKSGGKINTIAGMTLHPKLNTPCWTFKEDDSYVECRQCIML